MAQDKPQTDRKHPPRYQGDLEPNHMAGQNLGEQSADAEPGAQNASDIKALVTWMQDFTHDELREIPVLRGGTRLQQGATYLRIDEPDQEPFTATGDMVAPRASGWCPRAPCLTRSGTDCSAGASPSGSTEPALARYSTVRGRLNSTTASSAGHSHRPSTR